MHGDPAIEHGAADVAIRLEDGRRLQKHVAHARGSLERPMSDRDLEDKFRSLAAGRFTASAVDRLIAQCWLLAELPDAGALARASRPHGI